MRLSDFKALTFDCYGTLIDWESGMVTALLPLTSKVQLALSRNAILEFRIMPNNGGLRFDSLRPLHC